MLLHLKNSKFTVFFLGGSADATVTVINGGTEHIADSLKKYMQDEIKSGIKTAMMSKDTVRLGVLRGLSSCGRGLGLGERSTSRSPIRV